MAKFEITKKVCEIADKISDERDICMGFVQGRKGWPDPDILLDGVG